MSQCRKAGVTVQLPGLCDTGEWVGVEFGYLRTICSLSSVAFNNGYRLFNYKTAIQSL